MKDLLETIDLYDDDTPGMADGGRIPLNKGNMSIKQALEEILREKGTNFTSQKELTDLVAEKVGYKPNVKILRPSKYPILRSVTYKSTSKAFTDKELKEILGDDLRKFRAQGLTDREIRDRASGRKQFKSLSDVEKAAKRERNKINLAKRISKMSPDEIEAMRIKDAIRMQEQRGTKPKYHRVSNAKSLLWNDLIRAAEAKDGYLSFKNFTPEPGKYYNKAETENITLVDRKGNEFKFNSLKKDIDKHSGYKAEDVFKPYDQREFLNKQGLTQELNRFYGIKPGSRQSVFNIQHVQGIAKNPFNVQLTFADQNIAEAGAKRTFDAEFKVADSLSKKKAAVKKFYKNLGADIPTQLGRKEVGARRTLTELLKKTKFPVKPETLKLIQDTPQLNALFSPGILKEAFKSIPTPLGTAVLTAGFGIDPTSSIDRTALAAEAAFAPALVKQSAKMGAAQKIFNLGLNPRTAARIASRLSPLGIASLAGEGIFQVGKLGFEDQKRFDALTPEQQAAERAEQETFARSIEGARDGGLIGVKSGPPPERGPDSQGLLSLKKRGMKI
jgi:uncharacterized protein YnzC (UPF0291/DUF896 family)